MKRPILTLALFFVVVATSTCSESQGEERPPNIIYILADDAGYGDFGCYREDALPSPNIDRLAAEGLRFTQHYAGCTVCAPSRCVLLTGLHTGHSRIRGNSPGVLTDDDVTIAQQLKSLGYKTGCVGKWGVGAPPPLNDPQLRGFDHFYGYISMWHAHNFYPEFLIRNGRKSSLRNVVGDQWKGNDGRGVAVTKVDYAPTLITDEAVQFIENNHKSPFFLYFAMNVPHTNNEGGRHNHAPEKGMEVPDFGPYADRDWPGPEKGFAAMLRNIDTDVGRIVAKVKELGIDDDTVIMFSSDNGPHQEGGHVMEFFNSNGDLRGMKRDLFEGGIRVPLIVRWPGKVSPGKTSELLSGFQDILPTAVDLANGPPPTNIDGLSLVPTLLGKLSEQQEHEYLYWEFTEQGGKRAIRQGRWKLVQLGMAKKTVEPPQLYDLDRDMQEESNVAGEHPQLVDTLTRLMDEAHTRSLGYPLYANERTAK
jgi:arylsulfatase A-like enzyme